MYITNIVNILRKSIDYHEIIEIIIEKNSKTCYLGLGVGSWRKFTTLPNLRNLEKVKRVQGGPSSC